MSDTIKKQIFNTIEVNDTDGVEKDHSLEKDLYKVNKYKDKTLISKIEKKLDQYPLINATDIKVAVNGGMVTLEGYIDAFWKYIRVRDLCNDVIGVLGVINNLIVLPRKKIDTTIVENILNALERNLVVDSNSLAVSVKDGTVTLSGSVDSWIEYRNVLDIVERMSGVEDIIDNLLINSLVNIIDRILING
jgi:osmotically-inducible protein OsmY